MKKAILVFTIMVLSAACHAQQAEKGSITMYFFWGQGCPHCEEMKPFIQEMQSTYPQLTVKSLETFNDPANNQLFETMAKAYNKTADGVPGTFIGDQMIEGYAKGTTDAEVKTALEDCVKNGCSDPDKKLAEYVAAHPTTTTTTLPGYKPAAADPMIMGFAALVVVVLLALVIKNRKQLM
jgi:thiol-disulfide isomerase/thioredoxin